MVWLPCGAASSIHSWIAAWAALDHLDSLDLFAGANAPAQDGGKKGLGVKTISLILSIPKPEPVRAKRKGCDDDSID